MTSDWMKFPARWGEFSSSRNYVEHYWMPRAHLSRIDGAGHRPLCWRISFPDLIGGLVGGEVDNEFDRCGHCARMEKK